MTCYWVIVHGGKYLANYYHAKYFSWHIDLSLKYESLQDAKIAIEELINLGYKDVSIMKLVYYHDQWLEATTSRLAKIHNESLGANLFNDSSLDN